MAFSIWKFGHEPFQAAKSDTLLLATPNGNVLWTCDVNLCHQFLTSPSKSRLPVELFKFFEVYGPCVGSLEGSEWKRHRKVVTSAFNPTTYAAVWQKAVRQTTLLIDNWSKQGSVVHVVKRSTSRLALHVISAVFFDKHLEWRDHSSGFEAPPPGHKISFESAMFTVLARLGVLSITPRALLGILPIPRVQEANTAFTEFAIYMEELRKTASIRLAESGDEKPKNALESIILEGRPDHKDGRNLSEESVLGNIFFTMLAGHETTGNTLAFAFYLLAIYPEYQEKIQEELQSLLEKRPWQEWTADQEYQTLQAGWMGAVLKEVLRIYAVVSFLSRWITAPMKVVDSNGQAHVVPENTLVALNFAATFKNPTTWLPRANVSSERRAELHNSPALDFDPSRWIGAHNTNYSMETTTTSMDEEEHGKEENKKGSESMNSSGQPLLFPFGQGPRSCPGRVFANVEMTAVLATILKDYNLQLVVDERVKQACHGDEKLAWEKTRDEAVKMMYDKIQSNIAIELAAELPIRLVRRQ